MTSVRPAEVQPDGSAAPEPSRDELAGARTVSRLHRLQLELIPAGAPRFLSAAQAKALLGTVRPRDVAGRTRRQLAVDLLADLAALNRKLKDSDKQLTEAVTATGTSLMDLYGLGPVGAARVRRPRPR
jgi:transposase